MNLLASVAAAVLLGFCVLTGGLYLMQRRLIYFPDQSLPTPAAAGVPGAQVRRLATADGLSLVAWYAPPAPGRFVVLYLHGNAGNIAYRAPRLSRLAELGWGVLLLEYRGYGGNPGTPSEQGLLVDARAGLAELRRLGIPDDRILLWGESLGTGPAVQLAAEQPVAGVLLEAPFTSMSEMAHRHFPWLPVGLLLRDRFDSLGTIGAVRAPILVMQGARDTIVPPEMGRRLADTAKAELWQAPQGGHNDLADFGLIEAASDFVRRRLPPPHGVLMLSR